MSSQPAAALARGDAADAAHARSIPAKTLLDAILALGISHVITVPDTYMKSLITAIDECPTLRTLTVCTEDEAVCINAGLYITGHRPMMLIQNNGLFACVNTLRGIALDAQVPTLMLIGQYGRDVKKSIADNRLRAVRHLEPTLDAWDVPYVRLDGPEDVPGLGEMYARAQQGKGPAAAIVGAPTS